MVISVCVQFVLSMINSTGKCNVHLTGYLDPEFEEEPSDDDEEENEEEAPTLVPARSKRKLENSNDASSSKKKVCFVVRSTSK